MSGRTHKHWIFGKKWQVNTVHPITQKHRDIASRERHDIATGKFQRWVKKQGYQLTDRTYTRYRREVLSTEGVKNA